uniref:Uncharacterized protein n=1 Tax=Fagus sylvatica TaxID=28930 RepID=A0A2N9GDR8_FAGSY
MLPFSSNPTGVGQSGLAVEPCQSRLGGDGVVPISAWRRWSPVDLGLEAWVSTWRRWSRVDLGLKAWVSA